MPAGGPLWEL
uniref:Uncharacterized protein n=1 Tax=Rhizophora mucronata TaxID=61149 RepID=A0A2P2PR33_RHIMU